MHPDAVQHSTVHSGASTEDASLSPDRSPALDDQPCDLHGLLGMLVFMASLVQRG